MNSNRTIYFDGEFRMEEDPVFSGNDRSVMYGDGCFETFRSYGGRYFRLGEHIRRLREGLEFMDIPIPGILHLNDLIPLQKELLELNDISDKDALIRIQVSRRGSRGYHPEEKQGARTVIMAEPVQSRNQPVDLASVDIRRIPAASLPPRFKLSNGINYIIAAIQAAKKGADDALMQTIGGWVSETTIANIFWMRDKIVFTPSLSCDILPGITRKAVIRVLGEEMDLEVREGEYKLDQLLNADCIWVCNSVRELVAVARVDGREFTTEDSWYSDLKNEFERYRNENLRQHE